MNTLKLVITEYTKQVRIKVYLNGSFLQLDAQEYTCKADDMKAAIKKAKVCILDKLRRGRGDRRYFTFTVEGVELHLRPSPQEEEMRKFVEQEIAWQFGERKSQPVL